MTLLFGFIYWAAGAAFGHGLRTADGMVGAGIVLKVNGRLSLASYRPTPTSLIFNLFAVSVAVILSLMRAAIIPDAPPPITITSYILF
jgi:hypothetical protein